MCVAWLVYMSDKTFNNFALANANGLSCAVWTSLLCGHPSAWRDSFMCVTRLVDTNDMTLDRVCDITFWCEWHDSRQCQRPLLCLVDIQVCDVNHSCAWHDSSIWVTWLWHTSLFRTSTAISLPCGRPGAWRVLHDMTQSCVWHDTFMCVADLFISVTWLVCIDESEGLLRERPFRSDEWVMSRMNGSGLIWMSRVAYEYGRAKCLSWSTPSLWQMSHVSYEWVMFRMHMRHDSYVISHTYDSYIHLPSCLVCICDMWCDSYVYERCAYSEIPYLRLRSHQKPWSRSWHGWFLEQVPD